MEYQQWTYLLGVLCGVIWGFSMGAAYELNRMIKREEKKNGRYL